MEEEEAKASESEGERGKRNRLSSFHKHSVYKPRGIIADSTNNERVSQNFGQ